MSFFIQAFYDLATERPAGFSLMPIPWHAMHAYALAYNVVDDDYDDLLYYIRVMDAAFMRATTKDK